MGYRIKLVLLYDIYRASYQKRTHAVILEGETAGYVPVKFGAPE